jgi:hypothetical protein
MLRRTAEMETKQEKEDVVCANAKDDSGTWVRSFPFYSALSVICFLSLVFHYLSVLLIYVLNERVHITEDSVHTRKKAPKVFRWVQLQLNSSPV